jgi:hypothetical protein
MDPDFKWRIHISEATGNMTTCAGKRDSLTPQSTVQSRKLPAGPVTASTCASASWVLLVNPEEDNLDLSSAIWVGRTGRNKARED